MKWTLSNKINIETSAEKAGGNFSSILDKDIAFEPHDGLPPAVPSEYRLIKTKEFDEYWSKEPFFYVGKELAGKHAKKREYLNKVISESGYINAPIFSWDTLDGLQFEDGRNRFALIRDMGIEYFPALIPVSIIPKFEELDLLA